ncbi:MAG: CoA transferase [Dehalococcoidales bacterium]|nr:CoA transferase [Dehalococcoidales bacterium]
MEIEKRDGVFSGLTILAFCWAVVGPLTMKFFADHGATVIRVETSKRPCTMRSSAPYKDNIPNYNKGGYFNYYNSNILSLSLNMQLPEAREIAKKLAVECDVFMENYTPGNMEKWGLSYEELKKLRPDIIMLRQSGYGSWGPYKNLPAFGMVLVPIAGLPNFIGWPGKEPLPVGVSAYTDCISPRFATATLIAALDYRKRTGKGQLLDLSQFETALYFISPAILDYAVNGREPERIGNSSPDASPHGVYPCKGDDRWCTIAVNDEDEWASLCRVMGKPELSGDERFSSFDNRKKNEDELNKIIGEWTFQQSAEDVMARLQAAGVPAGVVENTEEVFNDPQLNKRNMYWPMEHSEMGMFTHLGQSFRLSKTPSKAYSPSPLLGEHTEYVCTKILGMSDEEFIDLMQKGVFE